MKTLRNALLVATFALLPGFLSGCAHVISSDMRAKATPDLTFTTVIKNPDAHAGATVIWGGSIIDTENEENGSALIVLETPLDAWEEPGEEDLSSGRFIVRLDKFADPQVFRPGRRITVAGEVTGKEARELGEGEYVYPVVRARELHLWRPYSGAPYPYWSSPYPWGGWYGPPFPYFYYPPVGYHFYFGGPHHH